MTQQISPDALHLKQVLSKKVVIPHLYQVTVSQAVSMQTGEVEMLRCCLCMNWVHPVCCGDPVEDKDYVGVYTCTKCRLISDEVVSIEAKLDSMFNSMLL